MSTFLGRHRAEKVAIKYAIFMWAAKKNACRWRSYGLVWKPRQPALSEGRKDFGEHLNLKGIRNAPKGLTV